MAARDDFTLTDASAPLVAEICRELDGLPLAIELAAARAALFGMQEIQSWVQNPLSLLTQGCRTAAPRHQTLRATLDWSYATLSDRESRVFRQLTLFDRDFDMDSAVMEIADDTLPPAEVADIVACLAAKSLLVRQEAGGRTLYRFLTTTRAYALEKRLALLDAGHPKDSRSTLGETDYRERSLWSWHHGPPPPV